MGQALRRCSKCGELKPEDQFYRSKRSPDGRQRYCKACANAERLAWKKANRDKERAWANAANARHTEDERRDRRLRERHHITLKQYDALLESQGGVCAGCGTPPGDTPLHVDHDHSCCDGRTTCGECIRGLLCFKCNAALGNVNDDQETLMRLADYVGAHKGTPDQCAPLWDKK